MLILPIAVLIGVVAGWSAGGTWRALLGTRFWHPLVVLAVFGGQAVLELPGLRDWPTHLRFAIVLLTYLLLGYWLFMNSRRSSHGIRLAFGIVGCGWALNLLAIAPNGGMPVSGWALQRAGIAAAISVTGGHLAKHVPMNSGTALRVFGDTIPLSWFRTVVSPGDLLIAVGISFLIAATMRKPSADPDPVGHTAFARLNSSD